MKKNVQIGIKCGVAGFFKIEKIKNSKKTTVCDWFPNLVTNNGLDLFFTQGSQKIQYCFVGDGSTTPSVNDTSLDSLVAQSPTGSGGDGSINTSENYVQATRTYTYSAGTAAGNLSEIGVGPGPNDLFSRALILDGSMNPTTITVLPDEILVVTYQLRLNQPLGDTLGTVDGYDIVIRSANINTFDDGNTAAAWPSIMNFMNALAMQAYSGDISTVDSNPSGHLGYNSTQSINSYTPGDYSITSSHSFDTSTANGTIQSFRFKFDAGGNFQFSVDPAIVKTSDDVLDLTVRITCAREGELPS